MCLDCCHLFLRLEWKVFLPDGAFSGWTGSMQHLCVWEWRCWFHVGLPTCASLLHPLVSCPMWWGTVGCYTGVGIHGSLIHPILRVPGWVRKDLPSGSWMASKGEETRASDPISLPFPSLETWVSPGLERETVSLSKGEGKGGSPGG